MRLNFISLFPVPKNHAEHFAMFYLCMRGKHQGEGIKGCKEKGRNKNEKSESSKKH